MKVDLSPGLERRLRELALRERKPAEEFLAEILEEALSARPGGPTEEGGLEQASAAFEGSKIDLSQLGSPM